MVLLQPVGQSPRIVGNSVSTGQTLRQDLEDRFNLVHAIISLTLDSVTATRSNIDQLCHGQSHSTDNSQRWRDILPITLRIPSQGGKESPQHGRQWHQYRPRV